jgi:hypothetical protein
MKANDFCRLLIGYEIRNFKLTLTAEIPAGEIFGYGDGLPMGDKWEVVAGKFDLSEEGEQVFVFCESADGTPRPLSGLSYNGNFSAPNLPIEQYGETQSAIPESLNELGKVELPKMKNYVYNGPNEAPTNTELAAEVQDPNNWEGNDGSRYALSAASSPSWVPAFALALPLLSILLC